MKHTPSQLAEMARHALQSTETDGRRRHLTTALIVRLMLRTGLTRERVVQQIVNLANN